LEAELRDYVEKKRRVKDGLALKARTKSGYLAAIEPARVMKGGTKRAAGPLHPLAHKPLATLTASDIGATRGGSGCWNTELAAISGALRV
jgi:hypothetical protein